MDYKFLNDCKTTRLSGFDKESKKAYDSIINFLFKLKLRGKEKARQIDEYDGESLFRNTTLYPGMIYAFMYDAEKPTVYDDGRLKFEYFDKLPIVLITHVDKDKVRGINLNLCNFALRAFVINTLHNLDLKFYERGNLEMANKGQAPISNNVARVFLNRDTERLFFQHIVQQCKLQNTDILYRQYTIKNIKNIRMIEVWLHKYIPFLIYTGELKQEILNLIWKVVGIDKVAI